MKNKVIFNPDKIYVPEPIGSVRNGNQENVTIFQDSSIMLNGKHIDSIVSTGSISGRNEGYEIIDATGMIVTPGFVDSHTHLAYCGERSEEFVLRAMGTKYIDLLKSGNGILKTVRDTRACSTEQIVMQSTKRLLNHIENGVTTIEVKTGYGLDLENERKLLDAMDIMASNLPVHIVKTLLPLHAMPPDRKKDEYVRESTEIILPELYKRADFVDSFCDEGAFTKEETSIFFRKAAELGIGLRIHADEISDVGALELTDEFPVKSADHLLHTSSENMERVKGKDLVATILPGTAFSLGEKYVDSREWTNRHIPVAVASDISPLNPVTDIKFHGNLAIRNCHMSAEELFNGLTTIPAHSLGLDGVKGNLHHGADADLLIISARDIRDIFYDWANTQITIIQGGRIMDMKKFMRKSIKP